MCLGIPGIVQSIHGEYAKVAMGEIVYNAGLQLVDDIQVGDYVLLHSGYVLEKLNKKDALETLELFKELNIFEQ